MDLQFLIIDHYAGQSQPIYQTKESHYSYFPIALPIKLSTLVP